MAEPMQVELEVNTKWNYNVNGMAQRVCKIEINDVFKLGWV